jgi:ribosomal protein S18 acetylase RimI-like enzyme
VPTWKRATSDDLPALRRWIDADRATFTLLEGAPPRPDEAEHLLADAPPGFPPARKHMFIIGDAALVDVLEGYPDSATWYLGLIYVAPAQRGTGFGTRVLAELCDRARAAGATALRLAVVVDNTAARRLYDLLGFTHVARRTRTTSDGGTHEVDVLELAL